MRAPALGEIVILKGEEKNRNLWKLGKVVELTHSRDGVVLKFKQERDSSKKHLSIYFLWN